MDTETTPGQVAYLAGDRRAWLLEWRPVEQRAEVGAKQRSRSPLPSVLRCVK
jgi:hypothetical protein